MSNHWLRLWHEMPNDPKWRTIARASKQPLALVQAMYIHLLVDASRNVTRGHISVTLEDLASALDCDTEQVEKIYDAMQGRVLKENELTGWSARQPVREDLGNSKTGAKSAAARKREQRAREKEERESAECHEASRNVTTDKDTDTDTEYNSLSARDAQPAPPDQVPATATPPQPLDDQQRFAMPDDWQPDPSTLKTLLRTQASIQPDDVTPELIDKYRLYCIGRGDYQNNRGWHAGLLRWAINERPSAKVVPMRQAAAGPDFSDTSWADDLGVM